MKKNYLWQALVVTGIVTGLTLSATALGFSLKPNQIKPTSSNQQLGSAAALYGGFAARLTATKRAAFYQALGFNRNGELSIKPATAGSKVRLFEFAKYDATAIGLTRNIADDLIITDQIFQQADLIADLTFNLTLKRNLVTNFILRKSVNPAAQSTLMFGFKPIDRATGTAFTPTGWIAASASLHQTVLTKLAITSQTNRLIYFAKNTGTANATGSNADYALILDTKTGQLNLWTKAKLQHPLKLQVRYQTPIVQNPMLVKELDTQASAYVHPLIADLPGETDLKQTIKWLAGFSIAQTSFKRVLNSTQLRNFLSDINQNLGTSQKLPAVNLGNVGTDITTYVDASGTTHASKAKKYGIMAGLTARQVVKHLVNANDKERLYHHAFGANFEHLRRSDLNQFFNRGLTVKFKLIVALHNTDSAQTKKLLGKKSAVELFLTWNTLTNRFDLIAANSNDNLVALTTGRTKVTGIGGDNEPAADTFTGFAFGVGAHNAVVPAIKDDASNDAKIYVLINTQTGDLWTETMNAGLTSNDKLTFKFEFDSVLINE